MTTAAEVLIDLIWLSLLQKLCCPADYERLGITIIHGETFIVVTL